MDEYIKREDALDAVLFALSGTGYQSRAITAIREISAEDVVPKSWVVREVFWEIYRELSEMLPLKVFHLFNGDVVGDRYEAGKERAINDALHLIAKLEMKYMEETK